MFNYVIIISRNHFFMKNEKGVWVKVGNENWKRSGGTGMWFNENGMEIQGARII